MKDMFYEYDNRIDHKEYPRVSCDKNCYKDQIESQTNAEFTYAISGEVSGIKLRRDTNSFLFFNLSGHVEHCCLEQFLNSGNLIFQIVGIRQQVIFEKDVSNERCQHSVKVSFNPSDLTDIPSGIYTMRLFLDIPLLLTSDNPEQASFERYALFDSDQYTLNLL